MADNTAAPEQDNGPQQINTPPYPGTTKIENGQAYDIKGTVLGGVDDDGKPLGGTAEKPPVDYDALAKQAGSVGSAAKSASVDYDALAKQAGSVGSVTANAAPATVKERQFLQPPEGPMTISPREHSFHNWLQDVQTDVRNGNDATWFGSMMKKLGMKGSASGNSEGVAEFMEMVNPVTAISTGLAKLGEGGIEFLHNAGPVAKNLARGDSFEAALSKALLEDPLLLKKAEIGANKVVSGGFKAAGPVAAILAPETMLADAPVITGAMAAQHVATKTALAMGLDPDDAEMVGNVASVGVGYQLHAAMHPVIERFGVAVNNRAAAEQEYINRSRNLETARGQAAEVQQRAIEAAGNETNGTGNALATDQARQLANEAAKNVGDAQEAFDQASERRANATIALEKLHRKITSVANKAKAAEYERTTTEAKKASDLFRKAVPSKGANQYTPEDEDIARAHMEDQKGKGAKIVDLPTAYEAVENGRQGIEDQLKRATEPIVDEPLVKGTTPADIDNSPKVRVATKLAEMAKVDGNFDGAMDHLSDFNITDPTVGEAQDILTKLNNYQRAAMKGANNWDIYNMIETNPAFAARFFMADELRNSLYDRLADSGVEGAREARSETASLIRVRDAIGAQIRANRGGSTVRGSGSQSRMGTLVAKMLRKTGAATGAGIGADFMGVPGAVAGAAIGENAVSPVADLISPRDMTRDEHIEKSMKLRGTQRKPVEIKGAGTPSIIPTEPIPPQSTAPQSVPLTPRENTELHAELAAHYGVTDLDSVSYEELEKDLRKDIDVKKANGQPADPKEQGLLAKVLKADVADRAARVAAGKPSTETPVVAETPKTPEQRVQEADTRATEGEPTKLNPHLVSLGRSDESALVSHSTAMKAHAPAMEIGKLPEGFTSDDVHRHEWAHIAIGAVDGLEPIEIRSQLHPESNKAAATTMFNVENLKDAAGNVDPEKLANQETQWLTHKMAGPASHEIFKGMTRDEVKASPGARTDFRQARQIVRDVHPDFTSTQVEQVVDAAYDRAYDFLTKPHIADRIKANASVREEGLNPTLHASRGRVTQFAEDIRNAHNEYTGDSGPSGTESGEGSKKAENEKPEGEKKAGAGEGGRGEGAPKSADESATARGLAESEVSRPAKDVDEGRAGRVTLPNPDDVEEARNQERLESEKKLGRFIPPISESVEEARYGKSIPPERSTGNPETDKAIKKGGAIPGGVMKGDASIGLPELSMFHDPETGTTLALKSAEGVTPEKVAEKIRAFREEYAKAKEKNLSESNVDHEEVLEGIKRSYGVHDDPKLVNASGFITPDARYIDLPSGTDHTDAIEDNGGGSADHKTDNRPAFINETGTVRVHKARERAGNVLAFSVPKDGVTGEQADAIARSVGANGDRNGVLRMERADISADTKNDLSTEKEFPRASDVKPMLTKIKALEESNVDKGDVAQGANDYNKERGLPEINAAVKPHSPEFHGMGPLDVDLEKHPAGGIDPRTGSMDSKRYGLEIHPEDREVLDHNPTAQDFQNYAAEHEDVLKQHPDMKIGWDTLGDKPELNIGISTDNLDAAKKVGAKLDQRAIWDTQENKEIPTGGKNTTREFPDYPLADRLKDLESSEFAKSPKGSSVPLMDNPLPVKGTMEGRDVSTLDLTKALNQWSRKQLPALEPGSEPKEMVDRAKKIAEDEAKYQLAQSKTGTEWYTTEMKDHDKVLQDLRPELEEPTNMSLFKSAEAILSSGQKPYANVKLALRVWDLYKETGEFPRVNPETGKSWGPRNVNAYGSAFDSVNKLVAEKGEKGAADWLLSEHPIKELRSYQSPTQSPVSGKAADMAPGAMILGEKRGPFMQNLHGIESKFTADMWVSRTWNRWMGTLDLDPRIESKGKMTSESDTPRNNTERSLMKESFEKAASKLGLTTSSMQAVLWYYEQALYRAHGLPVESWSFSDAAKRVAKEKNEVPEAEQTGFNFGENQKRQGGLESLGRVEPKNPGAVHAFDFLKALKK